MIRDFADELLEDGSNFFSAFLGGIIDESKEESEEEELRIGVKQVRRELLDKCQEDLQQL